MADSTLMAIAAPQYFPQENCISWVGMMKLLFTVHNLHKALWADLNSISWYIGTILFLSLSLFFSIQKFILVSIFASDICLCLWNESK